MDFINYIYQELLISKQRLSSKLDIVVAEEQAFAKEKSFTPNTIYVVVKFLSSTLDLDETTQPIQFVVLSEENSLDETKALFTDFVDTHNYTSFDNFSQTYSYPVVMSNFVEVGTGKRSILYVSGELVIKENTYLISGLQIDNVTINKHFGFNYNYGMTPNTQVTANDPIATSVKSSSVVSIGVTIPLIEIDSAYLLLIQNILKEMGGLVGSSTGTGNKNFVISYTICGVTFTSNFKLTSGVIDASIINAPSLRLGFTR